MPLLPLLIIFTLTLTLSGCENNSAEQMLERYNHRLASSLELPSTLDLAQPLPLPPFPKRRDRLLQPVEIRQGLYEVLDLRHCQLLQLIAERNSSLGKVMPPSKQLVYELKFYSGISQCRDQLSTNQTDQELRQKIEQIWQIKKNNLPVELWNALYNNEAMERNFSLSEASLSPAKDSGFAAAFEALKHFQQLALLADTKNDWQLPLFIDELESSYQALYNNRFGSRWLRSISILTTTLDNSAKLIEDRLAERPLCYLERTNPKAKIVQNVFYKFYAAQVQPYMAMIDSQGRQWLSIHNEILTALGDTPTEAMQIYQKRILVMNQPGTVSLWSEYIHARDRHTRAWQKLLSQCGLMPS